MKTAVLVLGAQRSGTSVTSHLLSRFGVNFGDRAEFIQFEHNPIFFELNWVNAYNNKIIQTLGYKYTDFFLPLEEDFQTISAIEIEQELQTLIAEKWQNADLIGIKDPRFGLTFPVWQKALTKCNYQIQIVFVFRHPAHFLQSNKHLLQNWHQWTEATHFNFWLQLNLTAVYFTRQFPLHYVNYDQLINAPLEAVSQLATALHLDLALAADATNVVQRSYNHHSDRFSASLKTNHFWVDRCYQLLCSQSLSPSDYLAYRSLTLEPSESEFSNSR